MPSTHHTRGPILAGTRVALVGAALAGGKILADSEPGGPLALIAAGGFALLVGAGRRRVDTDR